MNALVARFTDPKLRRALVLPALFLVAWELTTRFHLVNSHILVRPGLVLKSAIVETRDNELISQLFASIARDLAGFGAGALIGVLVGSAMGLSPLFDRVVSPSFHAAKQVALFAWVPLMSVWLGTGETAKVVFIGLSAFYPVVVNTFEGIKSVGREHVEVARVFRFSRIQTLRRVVLPGAAPSIFAGLHLGLVYAWLATIGAEYLLAAAPGVGNLMIDGREQFAMNKVLLGVIIVGLVGFALNQLASLIESRVLGWRVGHT